MNQQREEAAWAQGWLVKLSGSARHPERNGTACGIAVWRNQQSAAIAAVPRYGYAAITGNVCILSLSQSVTIAASFPTTSSTRLRSLEATLSFRASPMR